MKIRILSNKNSRVTVADQSKDEFLEEVSRFLRYHESLGIVDYRRSKGIESFLGEPDAETSLQPEVQPQAEKGSPAKNSGRKHSFDPGLARKATLDDVLGEIGDCHRCSLDQSRTNIVFGQGPANAGLMIIADMPGSEDDRAGIPLQGAAGELLDKMLGAIGLTRDQVYITTLVKCFPGSKAGPRENEIRTCLPFLFRQIEIICPKVICALGARSAQVLLHSSKSVFQLRGRFYNFNDLCSSKLASKIVLIPSLHPGLLLKNAELKKASWHDLQLIQKKLEEE